MRKLTGTTVFFALALISTSQQRPREPVGPVGLCERHHNKLVRDIINKRRQAALGLKVTTKTFGIGRRFFHRTKVLRMKNSQQLPRSSRWPSSPRRRSLRANKSDPFSADFC